jgi:hypothetical protein
MRCQSRENGDSKHRWSSQSSRSPHYLGEVGVKPTSDRNPGSYFSLTGNLTGTDGGLLVLEPVTYTVLNLDGAILDFPVGMLDLSTSSSTADFTNAGSFTVTGTGTFSSSGSVINNGTINDLAATGI